MPITSPQTYCGYNPVQTAAARLDLTIDTTNAAGVYTASVVIPAYSMVVDIIVHAVALWNAGTSSTLIVGDGDDPNGYYAAVNLKATDLLADESLSFASAGGVGGAYFTDGITHIGNRWSTSQKTVTMELTTVGTVPTTGETVMFVTYARIPEGIDGGSTVKLGTYVAT